MTKTNPHNDHEATASALGFFYQSYFALLTLATIDTDNAAVSVEQLDDIQLSADGRDLLYQLKHSIKQNPSKISIKSKPFWRTLKVWIDVLPQLSLAETSFHLVTAGGIVSKDPLEVLTKKDGDRIGLHEALINEAKKVIEAREKAKAQNKPLPYQDRADGCQEFLNLDETTQINLLRRIILQPDSPTIKEIEGLIADKLTILHPDQRPPIAQRLIEWWDRQVIYSLCGKRNRIISRAEFQSQTGEFISDLEQEKLSADFETTQVPEEHVPDSIIEKQIDLVKGKNTDKNKAIREEWRAREQRASWINQNPGMNSKIGSYDELLKERWSDKHTEIVEDCPDLSEEEKCQRGLELLRWTHNDAPHQIRPILESWNHDYYTRGSYQVLAVSLEVGWHPEYKKLLKEQDK